MHKPNTILMAIFSVELLELAAPRQKQINFNPKMPDQKLSEVHGWVLLSAAPKKELDLKNRHA